MANATAKRVIKQAILNKGYKESPPGSNKTKFGKAFGLNGESWCAIFEWWCGYSAEGDNPIAHSASAAYIQEETVAKGGTWVMRKTASNSVKKDALKKAKLGDIASFDFGRNNLYRQHTGFIIGVSGDYYICIEGNTSTTERGSQSNGGCVAIRKRKYTDVCSIVRPPYGKQAKHKISKPYEGAVPTLPNRGYFKAGDKGSRVKALQQALNWSAGSGVKVDGEFGNDTLFGVIWFQIFYGLVPDGEFGAKSLAKLKSVIKKHKGSSGKLEVVGKVEEATTKVKTSKKKKKAKTRGMKIAERARKDAWAYGTPKKKYSYPNGKRKSQYVKDLKTAYGKRKGWGKQTKAGASCDVFVGTVIRALGFDKNFPRGLDEQIPYLVKSKKWKRVSRKKSKLKPGDIIVQVYKTGGKHIMIYLGDGYIANAHYVKKTYPIVEKYSKIVKPKSKCKIYRVYRLR